MLQNLIHALEEGAGRSRLRKFLMVVALLVLVVLCNWRDFRNFSTQEAMDSAQLARNISEGKGYTTFFVRPFSMFLQERVNKKGDPVPTTDTKPDYARVRVMHPDVSNPPVYPALLAGWMKGYQATLSGLEWLRNKLPGSIKNLLPKMDDSPQNPAWMKDGHFLWHPRDFFIGVFNQIFFLFVVMLTFFWAKKHFDARVAWMTAVLLLGSEYLWHFSFSGLSTMLLLLIFMGLVWCLTLFEREVREPKWKPQYLLLITVAMGLLVGLGGMTRYAFMWMIIPVVIFVALFGGTRRIGLALTAFVVFAAVMTPWIVRNAHLTGTPFGTSTYAAFEGTPLFPEYRLQRSLHPDVARLYLPFLGRKLITNLHAILQTDLPTLGDSWVTILFLTSLLISFMNVVIRRMRYFILMSLGLLLILQALGRTQLSDDSAIYNSENLLVLLVPLITVYGVSLFFVLLDQMTLPMIELRYLVIGLFAFVLCLPLIFTFLPPRPNPVMYPPYNPPIIEKVSNWMKPDELIMSDMPWAVAWYGQRQSIWLTLNTQTDFFEVNDFQKTVNALYLTAITTDKRFLTEWLMAGETSWGSFVIETMMRKEVPPTFPLRKSPSGFMPESVFLTDWERWGL